MDAPDFKAVFESSPNPYMVLDRELRFVAANAAYLRATGTTREALIGRHLFEAFPHDPQDPRNQNARLLRESLERVLSSRAPDVIAFIPYRVPRERDGAITLEERLWSATHTPILDSRGHVRLILQHTVDVTELHHAQEGAGDRRDELGVLERARSVQETNYNLDAERQHLRRLFEQAPGFVAVLAGPNHVFELVNAAYRQLIGHREVIGKPIGDALPEVAAQGFVQALDQVFTAGKPFVGTGVRVRLQRQPGDGLEEVFVDFVFQPIFDASGDVTGIFIQGNDITAQKQAQDELVERAAFERQLIGIVSHDLRNPVNAIGIAAGLLAKRGNLDDLQYKAVSRIVSSSDRARRMIRDFLDFTQARSSGRIPVLPVEANIRLIAQQVFDELRLVYPDRPATFEHEGPAEGQWDADRIAQVIGNLLSNAYQHSLGDARIQLRTRGECHHVVIEVQNAGDPIPAGDLARLFQPFERGVSAPSAERSVGLGLFISKQIVEAHQGTIAVQSRPQEGTTFTVRLPRRVDSPSAATGEV
jgi:PAS domain S-box-containing protein